MQEVSLVYHAFLYAYFEIELYKPVIQGLTQWSTNSPPDPRHILKKKCLALNYNLIMKILIYFHYQILMFSFINI